MLIIVITVFILEVILYNVARSYYYRNVESLLTNQIELSLEYFSRYNSSSNIEDIIIDERDIFWKHTSSQVQIFDNSGRLLMDSLGVNTSSASLPSDIRAALNGASSRWMGKVSYTSEPVMAVSAPIKFEGQIIGVIRFISSLGDTNKAIGRVILLLTFIGFSVVIISGLVGIFLANSIIQPLKEVTETAEKMADGHLKVRSKVKLEDEIGQLANTLNYMAEELLRKEDIKNDFISSISHELRTPLTSIKGWAITLQSEDLGENKLVLDGLEIIEKESDRLGSIVEDLLDFSRFVSGRIQLEKDAFNMRETLELIVRQLGPRAANNLIEFIANIDDGVSEFVGDENRIKQVLINLLDNAFKFTEAGGRVYLNAYNKDKNLIIEVKDNGIGISEADLILVKEKFYRGKNSKSHSGLGLSISDEIVKLHEGTMEITSKLGQGTAVILSLPMRGDNKQ